jgi:FERM domain-containing protein 6
MMQLHLRIRLYVDHVSFLRDKVTRHLYYLQLRDNLLEFRHLLSDETYFLLAAYALQADLGSFNSLNTDSYFEPKDYFPSRVSCLSIV